MKTPRTLILGKEAVRRLLSMKESIRAVESAFRELGNGRVRMPPKVYLDLREHQGDFRAMPAYIPKLGRCALKWVNAHPRNARYGLPAVMAVILLSDPKTGFPLCVMDGTLATNARTGAAGAVAAKYLARKDSRTVGLVGCGVQAGTQLEALREIFPVREVRLWCPDAAMMKRFARDHQKKGEKLLCSKSVRDCVASSDIVVTTTPSRKPLVKAGWIRPGTHINAIGADAPGKQELDPDLLKHAKVVVDCWAQASHGGEINGAVRRGLFSRKDLYAELGAIVSGKKKGRTHPWEITVFDSTGLAVQDVAIASLIYKHAIRKETGYWIALV